jgi:hypothetical protein
MFKRINCRQYHCHHTDQDAEQYWLPFICSWTSSWLLLLRIALWGRLTFNYWGSCSILMLCLEGDIPGHYSQDKPSSLAPGINLPFTDSIPVCSIFMSLILTTDYYRQCLLDYFDCKTTIMLHGYFQWMLCSDLPLRRVLQNFSEFIIDLNSIFLPHFISTKVSFADLISWPSSRRHSHIRSPCGKRDLWIAFSGTQCRASRQTWATDSVRGTGLFLLDGSWLVVRFV